MWRDPFTQNKFNDNSRVIQIEGNIGAGKHEFAHKLANELDMFVMPDINVDDYYINEHGFDYAALNPLLPERLRNCTMEMFHENPARHSVVHMQYYMFKLRILQYIKAIRHVFNTGQGVILVRSAYTERVMVEAMHNIGWLPKGYLRGDGVQFFDWKDRYIYTRNLVLANLLKPHLTLYLDTPVDKCLDNLKRKNDPTIANSKALTSEFLQAIEGAYNEHVLPSCDQYSYIKNVDHTRTSVVDIEDLLDEVEKVDFLYDEKDTRYKGWFPDRIWLWYNTTRRDYSTLNAASFVDYINQPWFDIAGLGDSIDHVDLSLRQSLYEGHAKLVGQQYNYFNDPNIRSFREVMTGNGTHDERLLRCFKTDCL